MFDLRLTRLWCLTPLSTIFQLYRGSQFWIFYFLHRCFLSSFNAKTFSFLFQCQDFHRTWLYIWVIRWVSYKKQELLTLHEHPSSSQFLVGSVLLIFLCLYVLSFTTHIVLCICFVFLLLVFMYPMSVCASFSGLSIFYCPFGII
jgi:hypothetical protein